MMPGHDETPEIQRRRPSEAVTLLSSFFLFLAFSMFSYPVSNPDEAFTIPIIFLTAFANYIPLILFPLVLWQNRDEMKSLLGLGFNDLRRTRNVCIFAFIIAILSQPGFIWARNIAFSPDWDIYMLAIVIPILAILIPLFDLKISQLTRISCGMITLIAWGIHGHFFPLGSEELSQSMEAATQSIADLIALTFFIGLFVPFAEEIFFRGFVMKYFTNRIKGRPFFAILITSALFGFAHLGVPGASSLVLFAIPLGMMAYAYRSLYPAIFAHAGLNLSGIVVLWVSG